MCCERVKIFQAAFSHHVLSLQLKSIDALGSVPSPCGGVVFRAGGVLQTISYLERASLTGLPGRHQGVVWYSHFFPCAFLMRLILGGGLSHSDLEESLMLTLMRGGDCGF